MDKQGNKKNDDIKKRLETIIGILLNQSIQQTTLTEKIRYLSDQKYENQEIANMLGTSYNMVAKVKSESKPKTVKVKKNEWTRDSSKIGYYH